MEEHVQKVTTVEKPGPEHVVTTITKVVPPAIKTEHPQVAYEKKKAIFRLYQVVWFILGIIEILLGFRITLKALGANPFGTFVSLIYTLSTPFAIPFQGIIPTTVSGNTVFEWSTMIAAVVYLCLAWGIIHFFSLMKPVTPEEVEMNVDSV